MIHDFENKQQTGSDWLETDVMFFGLLFLTIFPAEKQPAASTYIHCRYSLAGELTVKE
jgi:hypothetical protein